MLEIPNMTKNTASSEVNLEDSTSIIKWKAAVCVCVCAFPHCWISDLLNPSHTLSP